MAYFNNTKDFLIALQGKDGDTPHIKDGYWYIGDKNQNVRAVGQDGASTQWYAGEDIMGTTNVNSSNAPAAKSGDLYLNTLTGNVYLCVRDGGFGASQWVYKMCIKAQSTGVIKPVGSKEEMDEILGNEDGSNVGNVYMYLGGTVGGYKQGAVYKMSEVKNDQA